MHGRVWKGRGRVVRALAAGATACRAMMFWVGEVVVVAAAAAARPQQGLTHIYQITMLFVGLVLCWYGVCVRRPSSWRHCALYGTPGTGNAD